MTQSSDVQGNINKIIIVKVKFILTFTINYATTLFEGLQVKPHPIHGFRGQVSGYRFTQTVTVGYGQALANPQFGPGGLDQFYVPNVQKLIDKGILVLVDTIDLVK